MSKTDKTDPYFSRNTKSWKIKHTCVEDDRDCNAPLDSEGRPDVQKLRKLLRLTRRRFPIPADQYIRVCWPEWGHGWNKNFPAYGVKEIRREMNRRNRHDARKGLRTNVEIDDMDVEPRQPRNRARWECDL